MICTKHYFIMFILLIKFGSHLDSDQNAIQWRCSQNRICFWITDCKGYLTKL